MKIFVTGGFGFIEQLNKEIKSNGFSDITCIDSLNNPMKLANAVRSRFQIL